MVALLIHLLVECHGASCKSSDDLEEHEHEEEKNMNLLGYTYKNIQ